MATYTTNYNLEKPAQNDIYNVDVFNANADKIDAGLTDKAEKTMLAPVETTNSASRSYAKGEYFVYNNVLCCATTAIAAGGTIAIGTNCSTAPVGGELTAIKESLSSSWAKDGSNVNLASYTSQSNAYICPSDGYILIAGGTGNTVVQILDGYVSFTSVAGATTGFFVRKGTNVWISTSGGSGVYFRGIARQ